MIIAFLIVLVVTAISLLIISKLPIEIEINSPVDALIDC
jgi:uncharacterized membrane protein YvlD (DUF360 family)